MHVSFFWPQHRRCGLGYGSRELLRLKNTCHIFGQHVHVEPAPPTPSAMLLVRWMGARTGLRCFDVFVWKD